MFPHLKSVKILGNISLFSPDLFSLVDSQILVLVERGPWTLYLSLLWCWNSLAPPLHYCAYWTHFVHRNLQDWKWNLDAQQVIQGERSHKPLSAELWYCFLWAWLSLGEIRNWCPIFHERLLVGELDPNSTRNLAHKNSLIAIISNSIKLIFPVLAKIFFLWTSTNNMVSLFKIISVFEVFLLFFTCQVVCQTEKSIPCSPFDGYSCAQFGCVMKHDSSCTYPFTGNKHWLCPFWWSRSRPSRCRWRLKNP